MALTICKIDGKRLFVLFILQWITADINAINLLKLGNYTRNEESLDTNVVISNQAEFDSIVKIINSGHPVNIHLADSTRFLLKEYLRISAPATIKGGKGTIIEAYDCSYAYCDAIKETETHYVCSLKEPIPHFSFFVDEADNLIRTSEESNDSTKMISTFLGVSEFNELGSFKLEIPKSFEHLRNKNFNKVFGVFNAGWVHPKFSVQNSDSSYLYCKALTVLLSRLKDPNMDIKRYKQSLDYLLFNVRPKEQMVYYTDKHIYIPKNIEKLKVVNADYSEKETDYLSRSCIKVMDDASFYGIEFTNAASFIGIYGDNLNVKVTDCNFRNTCKNAIESINKRENKNLNINIGNCHFMDCGISGGSSIYINTFGHLENSNCNISDCVISNSDLSYFKSENYGIFFSCNGNIINNKISNTARACVYLRNGSINVLDNEIFYTDEYNQTPMRNRSKDNGAVYVVGIYSSDSVAQSNTTNKINIEYNKIYNMAEPFRKNYGIYIDEGRGDVSVRYNIILSTSLFSITSRNVTVRNGKKYSKSSIRNVIEGNVMTAPYFLEYGEGVTGSDCPISRNNVLLCQETYAGFKTSKSDTDIEISSFQLKGKDIFIDKVWTARLDKRVASLFKFVGVTEQRKSIVLPTK